MSRNQARLETVPTITHVVEDMAKLLKSIASSAQDEHSTDTAAHAHAISLWDAADDLERSATRAQNLSQLTVSAITDLENSRYGGTDVDD